MYILARLTKIRLDTLSIYAAAIYFVLVINIGCSNNGSSTPAAVTTYFVDAGNGVDTNTGTSSAAPWKTLHKVSATTFPAGTTVYLKRGEIWYEQLTLSSSSMTIDAYGSGALPVIDGSVDVGSSDWVSLGGDVYSKTVALDADEGLGNVSENGTMLQFVAWDTDFSTTFLSTGTGSYAYDYPNTIYIKVATDPANNSYRASRKFFGVYAADKSHININNIQVQRFSLNGIGYVNCTQCGMNTVVAAQGGGAVIVADPLLYAGNGIECDNACSHILIDNVTVSEIFDSGISPQTFIGNQAASAITIQNSTVDKAGFAGVEISVLSNGGSTGSSILDVTVSDLIITNSGRGWSGRRYGTEGHGIRVLADTGAGTMSNILIQNTSISNSVGDGIRLGGEIGEVIINRSSVDANNIGINVADADATSLKLLLTSSLVYSNNGYGINFNAPNAAGFEIYQNTLVNNTAINLAVINQAGEAKLQNNIFYSSVAMTHLYVDSVLAGAVTVDNNCYNNVTNMFGYNSVAYDTVAAFTGGVSLEASGFGGVAVNFTNLMADDFTLQSDSQCRSLGVAGLGVTVDYAGQSYATPPSSGAYEF